MNYLIEASIILVIFYGCYQLLLQRETFFSANRWFLLTGLIVTWTIPLVVIPNYITYTPIDVTTLQMAPPSINSMEPMVTETPFDFWPLVYWTYLLGVLFFSIKLTVELLSLRKIIKNGTYVSHDSLTILETNEDVTPFSFFNWIVYNPNQFRPEDLIHVINHEKVHTRHLHSIDTCLAQIACIIFWFNPIVWFYKKALQQNLEFIADKKAQYHSSCKKSYQTVLLKASVQNHQLAFTNNFYTSLIKKRIVMLHKSKSNNMNKIKLIAILPLLAVFMMSFNIKDIYVPRPIEDTALPLDIEQPSETIEIIITKATTDAELKSIQDKLKGQGITFNYSNITRNKQGEITSISTTFESGDNSANYNINSEDGIKPFRFKSSESTFGVGTISEDNNTFYYKSKDGTVKAQSSGSNVIFVESDEEEEDTNDKHYSYEIKKGQDIDTVFLKRANNKATWISKDGSKTNINASENGNKFVIRQTSSEPIFIIDGKVVAKSTFEDVDSDNIQSINMINGKAAIQSQGKKGKNGVVIMTTKGSNIKTNNQANFAFFSSDDEKAKPLIILDGKEIPKEAMNEIHPRLIESLEVLKEDKAVKVYGEKGKNGAIIIKSIHGSNGKHSAKPVIVEVEDDGPWKIETAVSSVYFTDDSGALDTLEFVISKKSSDAFLQSQKEALKSHGIDAKFSKVRRNKAGEITSIKISLDDNNGRKSSASWKEKDQAIPDIVMGKSTDDKLFVRAIGH